MRGGIERKFLRRYLPFKKAFALDSVFLSAYNQLKGRIKGKKVFLKTETSELESDKPSFPF